MFDYQSKLEFRSELYPDVVITLRRMSEGRKAQLRQSLVSFTGKYRELQHQLIEIDSRRVLAKDKKTGEVMVDKDTGDPLMEFTSTADRVEYLNMLADMERLEADMARPLYLAWAIESIEGLRIDGQDADFGSLLAVGPSDLVDDVVLEIKRLCGLLPSEQKNSASPTTLSVAAGTATTDTAADHASSPEDTNSETAPATSAAA
jgi:hypothetical protein